jgi:hypothetical protein
MSFTDENNLEIPTSGVADWDSPLNGNFNILARGFEFKAVAGAAVNTGDAITVVGSGYVVPHNSHSMDLASKPIGISRTSHASGDAGQFTISGVIRSLDVFSGMTVGDTAFVNPASAGMITGSLAAAQWPVGIAVDKNAVLVNPQINRFPEHISDVRCFEQQVNSSTFFEMDLGNKGWIRRLHVISTSVDAYRVIFYSNSTRASSETLFETVTTSVDGGASDYDIQSLDWIDRRPFSYRSTNTASPSLIYGTLTVQSASAVGSGIFHVLAEAERNF